MGRTQGRAPARQNLIKAYVKLLAQKPHRKVTVSAVVKEADCNRDTFYYHFASLDDAARDALDELAPDSMPALVIALLEGRTQTLPQTAKRRIRLLAHLLAAHPSLRPHFEAIIKQIWITELGIRVDKIQAADEAVFTFMAAGVVGFVSETLAHLDEAAFDAAFVAIAQTVGKNALAYAARRGLMDES